MEIPNEYRSRFFKTSFVLLVVLIVYFGAKALNELKIYQGSQYMGGPTITLNGHGEVKAVPDVATVYFTVESTKPTQGAASEDVNTKTKKVLDLLKSSGVAEKDIKTEGYSSYPKYSNSVPCVYPMREMYYPDMPTSSIYPPCQPTESKITGYTVSQSVTVKVRKVDDASKIIDGINKIGVSNMSGPNFTIDEPEVLKAEARKKAIADAKEQAEVLAKDLGVRLGKVQSFNENGGYGGPMYYEKSAAMDMGGSAPAPELPKGENTIASDVTITYEIK